MEAEKSLNFGCFREEISGLIWEFFRDSGVGVGAMFYWFSNVFLQQKIEFFLCV